MFYIQRCMQNSIRFTQWNHLFYFLLQEIILILKCSRYFICSESIKKMSIFAYLVLFSFFQEINADSHVSIQEIEYFTFSYIHGWWLFILWFHCGCCNKKWTFRGFTGFGLLQTSETSGRNMTVELDSRHPLLPKAGWGKWRFDSDLKKKNGTNKITELRTILQRETNRIRVDKISWTFQD